MKVLCVDTSSTAGSVVLAEDSKILGEVNLNSSLTHTSRLLTSIQHILNHVDATVVGCCVDGAVSTWKEGGRKRK